METHHGHRSHQWGLATSEHRLKQRSRAAFCGLIWMNGSKSKIALPLSVSFQNSPGQ
jgi:hypothetical protein